MNHSEQIGDSKIIFVVGNSRSGTTMLGRILGNVSNVFTFNELHFFEQIWQPRIPAQSITARQAEDMATLLLGVQRDGYYEHLDAQKYAGEISNILNGIEELTPPVVLAKFLYYETFRHAKQVPCDQTPRNLYYLQEILELYPQAFIVNIIRDPRGVLLSQKNRWRRRSLSDGIVPLFHLVRQWIDYHPITISLIWANGVMAYERLAGNSRVTSLRFEDLLADPKSEIRRICELLGLEYSHEILDVPQVGSSLSHDSLDSRGINQNVAEQWRRGGLSQTELWICQKITRAAMQPRGYTPIAVTPNWFYVMWSGITWLVKSGLAFIFNFRRARNPFRAVSRRLGLFRK